MSIKLHHGFRIHVDTLPEFWKWRERVISNFEIDAKRRLSEQIAADAVFHADNLRILKRWKVPVAPLETRWDQTKIIPAIKAWLAVQLEESQGHCLRDHYQLDMSILFSGKHTLALVHHDSNVIMDWFAKQPKVEEFPYWDNTDQPKGMSRKAWKARGKIWDRALPTGVPARDGVHIQSRDPDMFLWERVQDTPFVCPPLQKRAERLARVILEHKAFSGIDIGPDFRLSQIVEISMKLRKHPGKENLIRIIKKDLKPFLHWRNLEKIPVTTTRKESPKP